MRVALYVRVSTTLQAQTQSSEDQLERLRAHIQRQRWEVQQEYVFRDDGFSGATLRRPGLDRLRDLVASSALDRVLVTSPDRLARNYVHQVLLLEELERFGCQVEFLDRPMSQDPHDQLLLQIRGAVAEYERTLIAERMRRGRQRKLRAGLLLPWSRPPYGYRLSPERPRDPAGVWVERTEATVVQEIFARYLRPKGTLLGVAKSLYLEGIPTPRGQGDYWQKSTIEGILTNPAYLGQVVAGRYRSRPSRQRYSPLLPVTRHDKGVDLVPAEEWLRVATIPQIIPQEQFDQAQAKLAQNKQRARRNNTTHEYLLRALVSCGVCKLSCCGRVKTGGYRYYVCHTKTEGTPAQRCRARYIPAQQLDDVVWQDLHDLLIHPDQIGQALAQAQAGTWLPQELQGRREQLRQGRVSLEGQLERLTDAYQSGILPLEEYQRRRRAVEQNRQVLERQAEHLLAQVDRQQELAGMITSIEVFSERVSSGLDQATFEQKRQLVELLIDRVVVTNGEVEIRYVFPTSPKSEHVRFGHLRTDYLPDVRRGQGLAHPLGGVLALAVCALLCGARSQYAVSQWGQDCGPAIRAALGLKRERGPSVATVHRLFRHLDQAAFERVLGQWFAAQGLQAEEAIAIDGKTLRGIHGEEVPGVHLVAAFAHQTRTVLAQAATQGKGHELAGVRAVLASLPARILSGHVITGDALLAQRALCRQMVEKGGTISSS